MNNTEIDISMQGLELRLSALVGTVANQQNAAENRLLVELASHSGSIKEGQGQVENILNRIENSLLLLRDSIDSQRAMRNSATQFSLLQTRGLAALIGRSGAINLSNADRVIEPMTVTTLEQQAELMRAAAPINFDVWHRAFIVAATSYKETSDGNLSHVGHVGANYFRMFVNIHARGRILDVGCGQLAIPEYMCDWSTCQMAGIDPLPPISSHPFAFAQTFAENLPWPDCCFETVVVGTSLDHVYLLDVALAEIKRVLKPRGRLLIWSALLPFSPPYDPYGGTIIQPDEFHLFHPGKNWFPQLFHKDYETLEEIETVGSAVLIALERRPGT